MLIRTFVAPLLDTNCYLVADDDARCVVVDPGAGVVEQVLAAVEEHGLDPVGVLVTHGHADHSWSAATLCHALGLPLSVHRDDAYRIADPIGSLGPLGRQLAALVPDLEPPRRPDRVEPFEAGPDGRAHLDLGGLRLTGLHTPGHTEGSTVYLVGTSTALTGDVLFAGTIGRTDLPGGDPVAMTRSLARLALLDPAVTVLPGHGPATTIGAELTANPYLQP